LITSIEAFLRYGFLQRALLAGIFIAIACAVLGVFLILRREAMIGHGLAHAAFAGVAIGLFLNIMPLGAALVVAVLTAVLILKIKEKAGLYGDTGIAIFSSVGFALGIIIVSFAQSFNVDLFGYLFGDILAIDTFEVVLSIALAGAVIVLVLTHYHQLLYMTFDGECARASGIKVKKLDLLLTVLTAVTVVMGMKVVGIILVSALLVIPAAAGLVFAGNFKQAVKIAVSISLISVTAGLFLAFYLNIPASGAMVLTAFVLFLLLLLVRKTKR